MLNINKDLDDHSICFISNVNNEAEYEVAKKAIVELEIPSGYKVEILGVRHAASMAAGYQQAMNASNAKYKIYLHQDVFVINPRLISNLLEIFQADSKVGMIGVAGTVKLLHEHPVWWDSPLTSLFGTCYTRLSESEMVRNYYGEVPGGQSTYGHVAAIDGLFMATQYDLSWRTDLFHGWHFYDISQSREFINAGYKVVIPYQQEPWVIHDRVDRSGPPDKAYYENMEIFKNNYDW